MSEAGDGAYLSYTEYALPVKVQQRPNEPISIFVGEKLVGMMVHTEPAANGRPSAYWLSDDTGNPTSQFLETQFDAAVGELLLEYGYIDSIRAYLMFDRNRDAPHSSTATHVLPDRNPEIEPSGLKPGLIGVAIGLAIAVMIFVIGRIFL